LIKDESRTRIEVTRAVEDSAKGARRTGGKKGGITTTEKRGKEKGITGKKAADQTTLKLASEHSCDQNSKYN